MELTNLKRELMPGVVSDTDLGKVVGRLREYETVANSFWRGVALQIEELNEDVRAGRR